MCDKEIDKIGYIYFVEYVFKKACNKEELKTWEYTDGKLKMKKYQKCVCKDVHIVKTLNLSVFYSSA